MQHWLYVTAQDTTAQMSAIVAAAKVITPPFLHVFLTRVVQPLFLLPLMSHVTHIAHLLRAVSRSGRKNGKERKAEKHIRRGS
jgi:hypothetical protein